MSTDLKGFVTCDDFITPRNQDVSPIYELSDLSLTYARVKKVIYPNQAQNYALHIFSLEGDESLVNAYAITRVVQEFTAYLTANPVVSKLQALINFTARHNTDHPLTPITDLSYNNIISHNGVRAPDYVTFKMLGVSCSIWLNDELFQVFYPGYDIRVVTPFEDFGNIIRNTSLTLDALAAFDPVLFNSRIEEDKHGYPTTHTKLLNLPYKVPNTTIERNCYFAFNIYGKQANYDHILKLELYRVLTQDYGLEGPLVEELFPSILKINEFFIVPRWNSLAIQTQVGQVGIGSQVSLTFEQSFDIDKYVTIYNDEYFLRHNTYNVPVPYNNLLLNVVDGYYTATDIQKFNEYYPDLISVGGIHPEFSRMSSLTQRFMNLVETMMTIGDSNSQTELFNKVVQNQEYPINIITRGEVSYLSCFFDKHQYYLLPKYEFNRLS